MPACLDDIVSDMSVFHRVDDITVMPGPRFFRLAWRLPAYEGVMRARALEAQADQSSTAPAGFTPGAPGGDQDWNPGTKATLMADPALQGIFSFG